VIGVLTDPAFVWGGDGAVRPSGEVIHTKRGGPIEPGEKFFGYRDHIPPRYDDGARALARAVTEVRGVEGIDVTIFGELFGGTVEIRSCGMDNEYRSESFRYQNSDTRL
jgi:hypothetical protein